MANLNKVMLIGRLTRDPELRTFANGGKVAKFGFAVNNRKKNTSTGQWEDDPVFLDIDVFNRGELGTLADRADQTLRKGQQIFIEGHLKLEQWTSQDGQKRSKISVVAENFQYLEPRSDGGGSGEGGMRAPRDSGAPARRPMAPQRAAPEYEDTPHEASEMERGSGDTDIPF